MDTGIDGMVFAISGAAAGIGKALACGLAAAGARVAALDVSETGLASLEAELPADRLLPVACDVSDEQAVLRAVGAATARFGRIDVLVNNAVVNHAKPVVELTAAEWRRVFEVNLTGAFLLARHVLPGMVERGAGVVINVTSALAVRGAPGNSAYAATKAALANFTNTLYQEVCNHGIRVHAIAPGLIDTAHARESVSEAHMARVAATYPGGTLGNPSDPLELVQFLASPAGRHMSGGTTIFLKP